MTIKLPRRRALLFSGFALLALLLPCAQVSAIPPEVITSSITRSDDAPQPNAPDYSGCGGINQPVVNADYEQQVVDLVNTERANRGLPPYKRVTAPDNAARYHSADLGQDNYFEHDTYDRAGSNLVYICGTWTRIGTYYSGAMGENIAAGYSTPASVMNGWMNSTGHRNNILSTNNWEIGVGYATQSGSTYFHYWTQDFGKRSGVYPLIINRDAASTDSRGVTLYIYGSFQEMRLRNDGEAWGAWQPFSNNVNWTLKSSVGTRTVEAELKSGSTLVSTSDTIYLNAPQLGNLPSSVTFLYSIPEGKLVPTSMSLQPANLTSSDPLTWLLTKMGNWFTLSTSSGTTPQTFQITPSGFSTTPGTYPGTVTVTVTDPTGTLNSPHEIDLTLKVIDAPLDYLYLPLIRR